ncbi:MAG: ABC-type transport auxiliary lipoprotein family protein [Nitrosospira sp.]|nr:ABC-type transport auxiliary lipoprotein family protein [Nitrosospira sp.]
MKKILLVATMLLTGCAIAPSARIAPTVYDLGLIQPTDASALSGQPQLTASLLVTEATAPTWLDSQAIQYRLAYHDPAQAHVYANSRWAAAPAALLTQRIRSRIAAVVDSGVVSASDGVRADYVLRLGLEEFSQVFDTVEQSRVVVRLRVSLVERGTRRLLAQRSFSVEQSAPTADAVGAVHALSEAGDRLSGDLIDWLAAKLAEEGKKAEK